MLSLKKYKGYNAILFFHQDMDGVVSAIIFKEILKKYKINIIKYVPIEYGERWAYISLKKWKKDDNEKTIFVLTDFSNGFIDVEIHTDHHQKQYIANKSQTYFDSDKKSNAELLNNISTYSIMDEEEIKFINIIDAAQYVEYSLQPEELLNTVFKYDKTKNYKENKMYLALVINNIIAIYKNKMVENKNFLSILVELAKPSLLSIYNTAIYLLKNINKEDYKKILDLEEKMFYKYLEDVKKVAEKNKTPIIINSYSDFLEALKKNSYEMFITKEKIIVSVNNIKNLYQNVNNTFQKVYNNFRYAPFAAYRNSILILKIFEDLSRIQISYNAWNTDIKNIKENFNLADIKEEVFSEFEKFIFKKEYIKIGDLLSVVFDVKKIEKQKDLSDFKINNVIGFLKILKPILKIRKNADFSVVLRFNKEIKNKNILEFHKILNNYKKELNNVLFFLKDYCKIFSGGHKKIYNFELLPIKKNELHLFNINIPNDYMYLAAYIIYNILKRKLKNEYKFI